ncbi:MAG: hypothetical protein WC096_02135 [Sphaerochaetaceae bacterium]
MTLVELKQNPVDKYGEANVQFIHRFKNGYGASVVRNKWSRGSDNGLFELSVIKFVDILGRWRLDDSTPISDAGNLTFEKVNEILKQIEALEA